MSLLVTQLVANCITDVEWANFDASESTIFKVILVHMFFFYNNNINKFIVAKINDSELLFPCIFFWIHYSIWHRK